MYRFLILFCTYMQIVMTNPHLLDRFFGKPVDESMDLFRNPKIHPYVYINEKSNHPKKSIKTVHWDNLHSSHKGLFSVENEDFCIVSKTVIIIVVLVILLLIFVIFVQIFKHFLKKRRGYSELECQGNCGCELGKCEICKKDNNNY